VFSDGAVRINPNTTASGAIVKIRPIRFFFFTNSSKLQFLLKFAKNNKKRGFRALMLL
jgi:hypothetical protein